jgi:hypothetical protein
MLKNKQIDSLTRWGWTSYRKGGEAFEKSNGAKLYCGNFYRSTSGGFELATIDFFAHRPIIALREICNSGKPVLSFDGKEVN